MPTSTRRNVLVIGGDDPGVPAQTVPTPASFTIGQILEKLEAGSAMP
jgi:hypothetical protein